MKNLKTVIPVAMASIITGCAAGTESHQTLAAEDPAEFSAYCRDNYYSASASINDRRNSRTARICNAEVRNYREVYRSYSNRGPGDNSR